MLHALAPVVAVEIMHEPVVEALLPIRDAGVFHPGASVQVPKHGQASHRERVQLIRRLQPGVEAAAAKILWLRRRRKNKAGAPWRPLGSLLGPLGGLLGVFGGLLGASLAVLGRS